MKISKPQCTFQCDSQQCLLKSGSQGSGSVSATLPLRIPTKLLNVFEEHVPPRLLDVFIKNKAPPSPKKPSTLLIEATIEEKTDDADGDDDKEEKAEAINLSASFVNPEKGYEYNINDIETIERKAPAYVQITKVPQHGNLVIKKFGNQVVLN